MTPALVTAVVLVAGVVAASGWVLTDSRSRAATGRPVVVTVAGVVVDQPEVWAILCLLASVVVLPLYLVARGRR